MTAWWGGLLCVVWGWGLLVQIHLHRTGSSPAAKHTNTPPRSHSPAPTPRFSRRAVSAHHAPLSSTDHGAGPCQPPPRTSRYTAPHCRRRDPEQPTRSGASTQTPGTQHAPATHPDTPSELPQLKHPLSPTERPRSEPPRNPDGSGAAQLLHLARSTWLAPLAGRQEQSPRLSSRFGLWAQLRSQLDTRLTTAHGAEPGRCTLAERNELDAQLAGDPISYLDWGRWNRGCSGVVVPDEAKPFQGELAVDLAN